MMSYPQAFSSVSRSAMPRSADDILTTTALSVLERVGFHADMSDGKGRHTCVLTRDGKQFESRPHPTRAGAVSEAANKAACAGRVDPRMSR